jgi:hypothetical protein
MMSARSASERRFRSCVMQQGDRAPAIKLPPREAISPSRVDASRANINACLLALKNLKNFGRRFGTARFNQIWDAQNADALILSGPLASHR